MWWQYQVGDINVDWVSKVRIPEVHGRLSAWNMNLLAVHPDVDVIAMGADDRVMIFRPSPPWSGQPPKLLAEKQLGGRVTRVAVHSGFSSYSSSSSCCCFLATLMNKSVALILFDQKDIQQTIYYETGDSAWGGCGNALFTAASSNDWKIRVWSKPDGECRILSGHVDNIPSVESAENDQLLVSTSIDCTLRVWDAQSGDQIADFRGSGWGWSAHLIKLDQVSPMVGTPKPFSVHKLAPPRPLDEIVSKSLDHQSSIDGEGSVVSVPEDRSLAGYTVEDNLEDDIVSQYGEGPSSSLGFRMVLGDNVYSSIWEIAANPDFEDEASWNVDHRESEASRTRWHTEDDQSQFGHHTSSAEPDDGDDDQSHVKKQQKTIQEQKEPKNLALFRSKLLGKYWIVFTTNSDFYLLAPRENGRLEPSVHYSRLLHFVVAPDQRALFLNQSLVWSLDRLAFSIYISDLSVLLIANQIGFVIAVRIVDEQTCFKLAFPRADQLVHPIAGISAKKLHNIDDPNVYLVYVLRLDGSLETFVLRNFKCIGTKQIV